MPSDTRGSGQVLPFAHTSRDTARVMSQENVDALRAVYDEWAKGNFQVGAGLFDRHVLFLPLERAPDAGRYLGIDGIREFMRGRLTAWTNLTVAAEEFIEADNSVVVATRQLGMGRESGAPVEMRLSTCGPFGDERRSVAKRSGIESRPSKP